jgi:HAE1 family hydrophobic/amphiphilic exporter-1
VLAWALGHRWIVIAVGLAALLVVLPLAGALGFEFMPTVDQGQFSVKIETSAGTNLVTTNGVVARVEEILSKQPEIEAMFTRVGSTAGTLSFGQANTGPNTANIDVSLVDKNRRSRSDAQLMEALRPEAAKIPGATVKFEVQSFAGGEAPIQLQVLGSDLVLLNHVAEDTRRRYVLAGRPARAGGEGRPAARGVAGPQHGDGRRGAAHGDPGLDRHEATRGRQ